MVPTMPANIDSPWVPDKILQHRMISKGLCPVQQVLVQWSGWPLELATGEDAVMLQQMYPFALAWGQATSQVRGNVSSAQEAAGVSRPRIRKPNPMVSGPDWGA
jgi:hypothetical protein